jgi:histidine triad (HIT) family protein
MDGCIFCKLVDRKIPSEVVHENESYLAILDISQFSEGHTIVIPKKHYEFIWDIPNEAKYMEFINKVANHYRTELKFKYVDSISIGRMVPHAHFHLIPHNGEVNDWRNALSDINVMQQDPERRISSQDFAIIADKFRIK